MSIENTIPRTLVGKLTQENDSISNTDIQVVIYQSEDNGSLIIKLPDSCYKHKITVPLTEKARDALRNIANRFPVIDYQKVKAESIVTGKQIGRAHV